MSMDRFGSMCLRASSLALVEHCLGQNLRRGPMLKIKQETGPDEAIVYRAHRRRLRH